MNIKELEERGTKKVCKLQEFGSIGDLLAFIEKAPVNPIFHSSDLSSERTERGDDPWSGTATLPEAMGVLQNGWTTFAQKLTQRIPVTTKTAPVMKSRPAYSVVGGQASVPRYIQGIPTNMIDRRPVIQKQKIIVINKDISFPARVSAKQIEEEGIKAIQIIQGLENRGYRVKLNMCWAIQADNDFIAMRVTVKKPEERLSLSKIAFPIAHPAMLRRIGFVWLERYSGHINRGFTGGYGRPATDRIVNVFDKKEIFLPKVILDVDKFIANIGK